MSNPPNNGNIERLLWQRVPNDIEGKKVDIQELSIFFPENDTFYGVQLIKSERKYNIYGRKQRNSEYAEFIAYWCMACKNLVGGAPKIIDASDHGGYSTYCRVCNTILQEYSSL